MFIKNMMYLIFIFLNFVLCYKKEKKYCNDNLYYYKCIDRKTTKTITIAPSNFIIN